MSSFIKKILLYIFLLIVMFVFIPMMLKGKIFNTELEKKIEYFVDDKPQFIVAGESRARDNIIPKILQDSLKLDVVNIGVNNCDLITIYNGLNQLDKLEEYKTYLISVSFFVQLDMGTRDPRKMSVASLLNMSIPDQFSFFGMKYVFIYQQLLKAIYEDSKSAVGFGKFKLNKNIIAEKGYVPQEGMASDSLIKHQLDNNPFFSELDYDNKYDVIQKTIEQFGEGKAKIIFYQPSYIPEYYNVLKGKLPDKVENDYSMFIKNLTENYDNLYFLDLYNNPPTELTNEMYKDIVHLNDDGAKVFSKKLATILKHKYSELF